MPEFPYDHPSDCDTCEKAKDCIDKQIAEWNGVRVYFCKNKNMEQKKWEGWNNERRIEYRKRNER